ncbi:tetratricopeptide repeat protein [Schlesneria sp.]|uniref:tetratricopeptide repeat protein n=1 Tax=Schlesneria sp. TaxID=2762018 RepID=UPI002EF55DCB
MAVAPVQPAEAPPGFRREGVGSNHSKPGGQWIFNPWIDALFILLTPLVAWPAVLILSSSSELMSAETLSLIVTAFFATGHHLPGLIRAYGDRDLFHRFRWRFLIAPPLVFLAYFPLYTYHYNLYRLIILVWATWHGLMQVYGFVRIYDAKVGSNSTATAYWDWLVCLCGFITPQLFRDEHVGTTLGHWYSAGGPWLSLPVFQALRWASLFVSAIALTGFSANYIAQIVRGKQVSLVKPLMLASGIGLWCFIMLSVENMLIGAALFDICHDLQYLAIVWMFNCRRVSSNVNLGRFMTFLFRRGMVLLYLSLITAYGAIAFAGSLVLDGTLSRVFYGLLFTSTILHYYYDGFIWKVRDTTNRSGLGLSSNGASAPQRSLASSGFWHLLKWSPVIIGLVIVFATDISDPELTTAQKNDLERVYGHSLMGKSVLPKGEQERIWLSSHFQQTQAIADIIPDDIKSQLKAAVLLANFGRNDEALARLEKILSRHPGHSECNLLLGGIHLYRGEVDKASQYLEAALACARNTRDRGAAHIKLGELSVYRGDQESAQHHFAEAVRNDPSLQKVVDGIRSANQNR